MSLLRLLAAGKSLVGMKDMEARYRVTSQRLLPQFGGRNPFSSREKAAPAPTGPRSRGSHKPDSVTKETGSPSGLPGERKAAPECKLEELTTSVNPNSQNLRGVFWRRTTAFLDKWKTRLAGLHAKRRSKAAKPSIPRFTEPPVQGELSLDRIRVVRNDLSDADLEVVPARLPATPTTRSVEKPAGAESAWGRMTARVLGNGRT